MSDLGQYAKEAADGVAASLKSGKDAYEGASRFTRMRLWFIGLFAVDVLAVVLFVAMAGGRPLNLEVWFQPGFPSNMIVFRNEGSAPLMNVKLLLDDRYRLEVPSLPTGLKGIELTRDFRDPTNQPPPDSYRPIRVRVETSEGTATIDVEDQAAP